MISSISTIEGENAIIGWLPVFHSLSQTIDMQFCASTDKVHVKLTRPLFFGGFLAGLGFGVWCHATSALR